MRHRTAYLVDWDAHHAAERAQVLVKDGWSVRVESEDGARAVKHMTEDEPDVLIVDLRRLPTQGRETARATRIIKGLRDLKVVFIDDDGSARSKAAGAVPDATFTTSDELVFALNRLWMHAE